MSKKLLALLLALVMIVGSFTSVLAADEAKPADPVKKTEEKKEEPAKTEEKKDEKSEEKKDEKSEEKKDEKSEEKKEEKKEEVKDEYLLKAIDVLKKAGFISGYSKDSEDFKAEKNVTRAEFASMIVRALNLEASAKSLATLPTGFKDVPTNLWANGYIAVAKQQGIINGYPNGTFQPNRQISYQDMATMLTIALGKAEVGTVYPAGYIVKAQQLGLFNKVDVPAYTDMATRGNVFKMLYNMVTSKEFGQRKILKAIVLENKRVENVADNEITVEVLDVVQKANWVGENRTTDKKGDQHKYALAEGVKADPEELLGKVVNVTVDKDDKVLDIEIDKNFDYIEGQIENVTPKNFQVNGTKYTVVQDERYSDNDERIYRTYLNNKSYNYEDFSRDYKSGAYDYARFTVKNGKVVFIDAYKFYDIAPVAEVKGDKVFYYDDTRDARATQASSLVGDITFVTGGVYSIGEKKNIVKDDVIHFYENYRTRRDDKCAIVKKNAAVQTKLVKTHTDRFLKDWIVGEKDEYYINPDEPYRLISSYEGKHFDVIKNRFGLRKLVEENVKILVAIDGSAQLIQSDKSWKDGIHAVKQVRSAGEVKLLPPREEAFWATETRDTRYIRIQKIVNFERLSDFEYDDIVYYEGNDKNEIGKMGLVISKEGNDGYVSQFQRASVDGRYITVGKKDYRYFENLNAYYVDRYGHLRNIPDLAAFVKDQKDNNKLEAYVMSEGKLKQTLEDLDLELYNFLSQSEGIANIAIFNNAVEKIGVDTVYAEVKDMWAKYTGAKITDVRFVDADGKVYDVELDNRFGTTNFKKGDIVELNLDKKSIEKDQLIGYVERVVIKVEDEYKTVEMLRPRDTYRVDGVEKFFSNKTQVFNKEYGKQAQVAYEVKDGRYILVIRYKADRAMVSRDILDAASDANYVVLTDKDGKQRAYRVNKDTKFVVQVKREENGREITEDKILGFGNIYAPNFETVYKNGEVEVETDRYERVAVLVRALTTQKDVAKRELKAAEDAVNALKEQKYDLNSLENVNVKAFEEKVEKALKDLGLEDKITFAVALNAAKDTLETTLTHKDLTAPKNTAKAMNKYSVKTQKEADEEKAADIKKLADNQSIKVTATDEATLKAEFAAQINAKLTLAGYKATEHITDANISNIKVDAKDKQAYSFDVTIGSAKPVTLTYTVVVEK